MLKLKLSGHSNFTARRIAPGHCFSLINFCFIHALLTKLEVNMAPYWLSSFPALLWTETNSIPMKTQKVNEANIQPS